MNRMDFETEFWKALPLIDAAVRAGEMPRSIRRAFIRDGQRWFRRPPRISRMHAAYGRRTRR